MKGRENLRVCKHRKGEALFFRNGWVVFLGGLELVGGVEVGERTAVFIPSLNLIPV